MSRLRDAPPRRPVTLWWAGPTALALLGASAVSVLLVPGPGDPTSVPARVVVAARAATPHASPHAGHPRPNRNPSPDDDGDDEGPTVVEPSREVESEAPDDDDRHERTASPSPSPSVDDSGWESPEPEESGDDEHRSDDR